VVNVVPWGRARLDAACNSALLLSAEATGPAVELVFLTKANLWPRGLLLAWTERVPAGLGRTRPLKCEPVPRGPGLLALRRQLARPGRGRASAGRRGWAKQQLAQLP